MSSIDTHNLAREEVFKKINLVREGDLSNLLPFRLVYNNMAPMKLITARSVALRCAKGPAAKPAI